MLTKNYRENKNELLVEWVESDSRRVTDKETAFYDYQDYRDLLKDRFVYFKTHYERFSLERVARKIGISRSFLKMILDKKRHIAFQRLSKLAKAFNLTEDERQFVCFLACKNLINDPDIQKFFDGIISSLREQKGIGYPSVEREFLGTQAFQSSLDMILASLECFDSHQNDAEWVARQLSDKMIPLADIERSLQRRSAGQTVEPGEKLQAGLRQMSRAINNPVSFMPCQMYGCSLAFDSENEQKAFQAVRDLKEKLHMLSEESINPSSVLFLNSGLICVAHKS